MPPNRFRYLFFNKLASFQLNLPCEPAAGAVTYKAPSRLSPDIATRREQAALATASDYAPG